MSQPETTLNQAIRRKVGIICSTRNIPYKMIKIHGSEYQERGTPDILMCIDGNMIWIETKLPTGKLDPLQVRRLKEWRTAGAHIGVAHTVEEAIDIVTAAVPEFAPASPRMYIMPYTGDSTGVLIYNATNTILQHIVQDTINKRGSTRGLKHMQTRQSSQNGMQRMTEIFFDTVNNRDLFIEENKRWLHGDE